MWYLVASVLEALMNYQHRLGYKVIEWSQRVLGTDGWAMSSPRFNGVFMLHPNAAVIVLHGKRWLVRTQLSTIGVEGKRAVEPFLSIIAEWKWGDSTRGII